MTTKERIGLVIGIVVLIVLGLLLSGCQTLAGACRDLESAARYGHEHTTVDE